MPPKRQTKKRAAAPAPAAAEEPNPMLPPATTGSAVTSAELEAMKQQLAQKDVQLQMLREAGQPQLGVEQLLPPTTQQQQQQQQQQLQQLQQRQLQMPMQQQQQQQQWAPAMATGPMQLAGFAADGPGDTLYPTQVCT